jgi:uncharacterized protein YjlB
MTDIAIQAEEHHYAPDGTVVNSRLPLLIYRNAVQAGPDGDLADTMIQRFRSNDWLNNWTERGVYPYPHFHSTSHEVLGVVRGSMPLRLGGAAQEPMLFSAGDVIVMPAGVSHTAFPEDRHRELSGGPRLGPAARRRALRRRAASRAQADHEPADPAPGPGHGRPDAQLARRADLGRVGEVDLRAHGHRGHPQVLTPGRRA